MEFFLVNDFSTVGFSLADATAMLSERGAKFAVSHIKPQRSVFKIDESRWRVVREQTTDDGTYVLTVAAEQQSTL